MGRGLFSFIEAVKYATADTQIIITKGKGQIPKVAVSGISTVVSAVYLGLPAKLGCICPRIFAHFGVSASGSGALKMNI
jgi:CxxC motif-containing protein